MTDLTDLIERLKVLAWRAQNTGNTVVITHSELQNVLTALRAALPVLLGELVGEWERYSDGNYDDAANARSRCAAELREALARDRAAQGEVLHIRVHNKGEYGSFYLREGVDGEGDRKSYWCELTCNTSFGTVGHYWSSMGGSAAWFLTKINREYLIGKLWGADATVFCGTTAATEAKSALLRKRRDMELSKEDAREAFDAIWDVSSDLEWHQMVLECDWLHRYLIESCHPFGSIENPQARGFWEQLWPDFLDQLTAAPQQPGGILHNGTRIEWQDSNGEWFPGVITGWTPEQYDAALDAGFDAKGYARGRFRHPQEARRG